MALDTRDWFVAKLRRRLGYRERAAFRINLGEQRREARAHEHRQGWRRLAVLILVIVAVGSVAMLVLKQAWSSA